MKTETLTVSRGKTDEMSNRTNTTHTVEGVFSWGSSRASRQFGLDREYRESAGVTAELYVQRGADLRARDRIERANGETYNVVGHSQWSQDSPFTGRNFGWMLFQVESMSG